MNRILDEGDKSELPRPSGGYSDAEALEILINYRSDPSDLRCPTCGPEVIEVLAFIEPEIDSDGYATVMEPEGDYAAALYCHACKRGIGLRAGALLGP
jgi:hypothetical protein